MLFSDIFAFNIKIGTASQLELHSNWKKTNITFDICKFYAMQRRIQKIKYYLNSTMYYIFISHKTCESCHAFSNFLNVKTPESQESKSIFK